MAEMRAKDLFSFNHTVTSPLAPKLMSLKGANSNLSTFIPFTKMTFFLGGGGGVPQNKFFILLNITGCTYKISLLSNKTKQIRFINSYSKLKQINWIYLFRWAPPLYELLCVFLFFRSWTWILEFPRRNGRRDLKFCVHNQIYLNWKNQSCSKLPEMARNCLKMIFGLFSPPTTKKKR